MATVGVGIDVVDVARFTLALTRHPSLKGRLFTTDELHDTHERPERLAVRFAAKEAVLKALRSGIGDAPWRSIEIRRDAHGAPYVHLHDRAAALARTCGVETWHLSMSHTDLTAAAFVVATSGESRAG